MTIDWLLDIERAIDGGREILACISAGQNEWVVGRPLDDLRKVAKRVSEAKKSSVPIVKLVSKDDTLTGDLFLVPTRIEQPGVRGEPQIKWSVVDTKEAAEMMRDVRHGPAPFFGMQTQETIQPANQP